MTAHALSRLAAGLRLPLWTELRIDVALGPDRVEQDLARLSDRLHQPGDSLYGLPVAGWPRPGFVARHREADGEHFVYVQDLARGRLAAYTVLSRLVEVDRRADRVLRSPHSKVAGDYRRLGLTAFVYEWALAAGLCLMSGPRQSTAAHCLWHKLARRHPLLHVHVHDKVLRDLGPRADHTGDLHTRLVLLGAGWTAERLAEAAHIRNPPAGHSTPPRSPA